MWPFPKGYVNTSTMALLTLTMDGFDFLVKVTSHLYQYYHSLHSCSICGSGCRIHYGSDDTHWRNNYSQNQEKTSKRLKEMQMKKEKNPSILFK